VPIDPYLLFWQQALDVKVPKAITYSCDIMKKILVTPSSCEALPPEPITLWSTAILWNP
jgi:hypothetical protein